MVVNGGGRSMVGDRSIYLITQGVGWVHSIAYIVY